MEHSLISCRDLAACRVIVDAEMCGGTTASGGLEETRDADRAIGADDRLRRFDHHLHFECTGRQIEFRFDLIEDVDERGDLLGCDDLWQRHDKIIRELAVRRFY